MQTVLYYSLLPVDLNLIMPFTSHMAEPSINGSAIIFPNHGCGFPVDKAHGERDCERKLKNTAENMDFLNQTVYYHKRNLTFFTRQNVEIVGKLSFDDEEILNTEITNPSTREGAVIAAKNEETINDIVATPSIREGTVLAVTVRLTVDNEETIRLKLIATSSIRKRAVLAAVSQRGAIPCFSPITFLAVRTSERNGQLQTPSPIIAM